MQLDDVLREKIPAVEQTVKWRHSFTSKPSALMLFQACFHCSCIFALAAARFSSSSRSYHSLPSYIKSQSCAPPISGEQVPTSHHFKSSVTCSARQKSIAKTPTSKHITPIKAHQIKSQIVYRGIIALHRKHARRCYEQMAVQSYLECWHSLGFLFLFGAFLLLSVFVSFASMQIHTTTCRCAASLTASGAHCELRVMFLLSLFLLFATSISSGCFGACVGSGCRCLGVGVASSSRSRSIRSTISARAFRGKRFGENPDSSASVW